MWATCYADASFSRKRGAWGVWLRCERGRIVRNGTCPPYVKDANAAELAALFAGMYVATSTWSPALRGISLRSDSQAAIALADPSVKLARRDSYRRLQTKIRELVLAHSLELDLRWVRGHQPIANGTIAYLNRECDRLAKRARRARPERHELVGVATNPLEGGGRRGLLIRVNDDDSSTA